MKIFKNWHLVKIRMIPMHSISSYYFNKVRQMHSDEESCLLKKGFEAGYAQSLIDGGISPKYHPKGKREL